MMMPTLGSGPSVRHFTGAIAIVLAAAGVVLLPLGAASASTVTVSAPTVQGANGSDVKVPISLSGASNLGALHVEITFDPRVLTGATVDAGKLAEGALLQSNDAPGRVRFGLATGAKIDGDGEIAIVHFKVVGPKGAQTPLAIELVQAWEATPERFEVKPVVQAGRFTVSGGSSSFPWWIVVAAVLAVLLLLFLLARRRRKGEPAAEGAVPPAGPPPSPPAPTGPPPSPPSSGATAPAATRFCPACGAPNAAGSRFCPSCGQPTQDTAPPTSWTPTHRAPPEGMAAWPTPDHTQAPIAQLDPNLAVAIRQHWGDWAEIVCENEWSGWVDARALIQNREN